MPKTITKYVKKELSFSQCGFGHKQTSDFVRSEWQLKTKCMRYLAYRWFVAIFFIIAVVFSLLYVDSWREFGIYFVYLTHLGLLICLVTGVYGAILVTVWHYHPDYSTIVCSCTEMPTAFKVYWSLHSISLTLALVISIVYWSLLYQATVIVDAANVLEHVFNSVIMCVDILVVAYPLRLYHVILPIAFGICYGFFTYIYHLCGGVNSSGQPFIYKVLDWAHPVRALTTIIGSILLAIFVHIILFCIYKLRTFVHRRLCQKYLPLQTPNRLTDA